MATAQGEQDGRHLRDLVQPSDTTTGKKPCYQQAPRLQQARLPPWSRSPVVSLAVVAIRSLTFHDGKAYWDGMF